MLAQQLAIQDHGDFNFDENGALFAYTPDQPVIRPRWEDMAYEARHARTHVSHDRPAPEYDYSGGRTREQEAQLDADFALALQYSDEHDTFEGDWGDGANVASPTSAAPDAPPPSYSENYWSRRIFQRYNSHGIDTVPTSRRPAGPGQHNSMIRPPRRCLTEPAGESSSTVAASLAQQRQSRRAESDTSMLPNSALRNLTRRLRAPASSGSSAMRNSISNVAARFKNRRLSAHAHDPANADESPILRVLSLDALLHTVKHLCFPETFSLAMTCKAMHVALKPVLGSEKMRYETALNHLSLSCQDHAAFCGVCLYLLDKKMFTDGDPCTAVGNPICKQCQDLHKSKERVKKGEDQPGSSSCMPVWRRSQRRVVEGTALHIWWRDASACAGKEETEVGLPKDKPVHWSLLPRPDIDGRL